MDDRDARATGILPHALYGPEKVRHPPVDLAATSLAEITLTQQKTGQRLRIPIHPDLQKVLQAAPRDHVAILTTAFGKPFTVDGFSRFMRDAIAAAGLPLECQPHGLRKAAGRRLAEAGCTAKQVMAVLGHKSLAEAERYTRDADQARLAKAAIKTLEMDQKENGFPNRVGDDFPKPGKTEGKS